MKGKIANYNQKVWEGKDTRKTGYYGLKSMVSRLSASSSLKNSKFKLSPKKSSKVKKSKKADALFNESEQLKTDQERDMELLKKALNTAEPLSIYDDYLEVRRDQEMSKRFEEGVKRLKQK